MEHDGSDIMAGIRELRAKAAEQLSGNEYYMIVQQLDALAGSADLTGELAQAVLTTIGLRLRGGVPPAETPVAATPAAEAASPPLEETGTVVLSPVAGSFGGAQATVSIRPSVEDTSMRAAESEAAETPPVAESEASPEPSPVIAGLQAAVDAARAHIETHFSGNCYYGLSNLLGQLRDLTPPGVSGEPIAPVSDFAGALASLRQEVGKLGGMALEEGQRLMSALEAMIEPSSAAIEPPTPADIEPAAAPRTPAPESAEAEPVLAGEAVAVPQDSVEGESEDDAGPRTGFDELADLSWRRVQQVTEMDHQASHGLNGAAALASAHSAPEPEAAQEQAPAPAFAQPVAEPQPELEPEHAPVSAQAFEPEAAAMATPAQAAAAEPPQEPDEPDAMERDIAEALNDGGSESRSSEPCYAAEFELSPPQPASRPDPEPAGETAAEQTPETAGQDAQPAESPCLTGEPETAEATAESALESGIAPAEPLAAGAEAETKIPPEAVTAPEAVPVEAVAVASEPAETAGAAPQAEAGLEAAAPPEIIIESEAAARTPEPEPEQMPKPERKGFFSRLFGGRAAEHR